MTRLATFDVRGEAVRYMRGCNAALGEDARDLAVIVEGPEDEQWTVMSVTEAVDNGFPYTWEA